MNYRLAKVAITYCSILISSITFAASTTTASFQGWAWLEKTKQLQAHFEQRLMNKSNVPIGAASQGEFWIQRPGRFRWHYQKPSEQLTISDGKHVIWYDPQLKQVVTKPAQNALNNVLAQLLIAPPASLKTRFHLEQSEDTNAFRMTITPIHPDQEGFQKAILYWSNKAPYPLERFEVIDGLEQRILFTLFDLHTPTQTFADSLFRFTPPVGTTVLNDTH